MHNALLQIVSPDPTDEGAWINQDAWFYLGSIEKGKELGYILHQNGDGVYVFVIGGEVVADGVALGERDGMGIVDMDKFSIRAVHDAEVLLIEVPMF